MATITVRDLDEATRDALRVRAARNGRSMEAEVRDILTTAVAVEPSSTVGLGTRIRQLFADIGYADDLVESVKRLAESDRESAGRTPPDFAGPEYGTNDERPGPRS